MEGSCAIRIRRKLGFAAALAVVIAVPVVAAWMFQRAGEMTMDCYAQQALAQVLIEHMERNGGQWPRQWSDLGEAHEVQQAAGVAWSWEELEQRCSVDFTAKPEQLVNAAAAGEHPPFRVVWLNNGKQYHWAGGEPNRVLYEYLVKRGRRSPGYRPPAHLVQGERSARLALLQQGAQWRVDERGHVVFLDMGSHRDSPRFTDADLRHVAQLTELQELLLANSAISDAGLVHLRSLHRLRSLELTGTQVTDAGIAHLGQLTKLEVLGLASTKIRGHGLERLAALPLTTINLNMTELEDEGVDELCALDCLKDIKIGETNVTGSGTRRLRDAFPNAEIYWAQRGQQP